MRRSVLILGLGASGQAAADYCLGPAAEKYGPVTVIDSKDTPFVRQAAQRLSSSGARVHLGCDLAEERHDLCVASPGIPPAAQLMRSARSVCGEVVSEIEFAFRESDNPWVAVTGTNGKTTTTALIAHLLTSGGVPARAVGNFGPPAIEAVSTGFPGEVLVAEVSSFQLALTERFHPRVAVLLNITPDHLDWHGSVERYAADKSRVFQNLTEDDVAVIDVDDTGAAPYADALMARDIPVVRVSRHRAFEGGATLSDGMLSLATTRGPVDLLPASDLKILGAHNVTNALAAAAAADRLGVSCDALRGGLASFEPIEHRLEPAGSVGGVEWFNDSKATNPDAVSKALEALSDRPLILLLGGRNKGSDFAQLAAQAARSARAVVVFGEAGGEIASAFEGAELAPVRAVTLADAVAMADEIADTGDAVLLSPGCASFDQFDNYEQRGRVFKSLVRRLEERA
jgi:UDP-N-acetylmuramoylalanine--D-glutamate ligase